MDKNVEAQKIANKYLETEISNFKIQLQSDSRNMIEAIKEGFSVELEMLEHCFESQDYSHIDNIINSLLPADFNLNTRHNNYETLRYEFFQARVKAVQEMVKMCDGPYSYNFKDEDINLAISLVKFFARAPAIDKWKQGSIQMKNQVLVNELGREILKLRPRTNKTNLSEWIADDGRMKNSESPLKSETIRKDYLDDF